MTKSRHALPLSELALPPLPCESPLNMHYISCVLFVFNSSMSESPRCQGRKHARNAAACMCSLCGHCVHHRPYIFIPLLHYHISLQASSPTGSVALLQYDIDDYREHLYAEILRRRKELKAADRAARDRAKGRSRSHKSSSAAVHDSHSVNGTY